MSIASASDQGTEDRQDVFISHASADRQKYILPLADSLTKRNVSHWLDCEKVGWGDSIGLKINEGLRLSRFVLVCLSPEFCSRPWTETELTAALSMQNSQGQKKLLPLILYGRDAVIDKYPILAGFVFREFGSAEQVASDVESLLTERTDSNLTIRIETVHTGKRFDLVIPPRVSNFWVAEQAVSQWSLRPTASLGEFARIDVRYVLVDSTVREYFESLSTERQVALYVVANTKEGIKESTSETDRFEELGVTAGTVFNLYPVQGGPSYSVEAVITDGDDHDPRTLEV